MLHTLLTATTDGSQISIPDAGILALLGYVTVFSGIIVLMLVVMAIGKYFVAKAKKNAVNEPVPAAPEAAPVMAGPVAPGAAGELKLYDVDPKTAAMLMAIVADKMGKPLNELRFLSVREVK